MVAATETGRRTVRSPCPSCQMRFKVGEPKAQDSWPAQLSVNARQMDLLLIAAAEFRDMCAECEVCNHGDHILGPCGECGCNSYSWRGGDDAISFLDWVRPEALSRSFLSPVNVQREAVSGAARGTR